jgi:ankyrin repeat protein
MLTTAEIISLYDDGQYDKICEKLEIECQYHPVQILSYAIDTCNPDLIAHTLTIDIITGKVITHIMDSPLTYDIFQSIIENNLELCDKIRHILEPYFVSFYNTLCEKNNIQFLKIIITYLSSNKIILNIVDSAITHNHLNILDILTEYGYGIDLFFSEIMDNVEHGVRFELSTILSLEKYIKINNYINEFTTMFFLANNIDGLKYCLDNGADVNCIWNTLNDDTSVKTISYLLDLGVDINLIVYENIECIIGFNDCGSDVVIFLIVHGLDISNYITKMLTDSIFFDSPKILEYLILFGADIHSDNELLHYAAESGSIECVKILLKFGIDINIGNGSILLFMDRIKESLYSRHMWFSMATLLIRSGVIITDPTYIFCSYAKKIGELEYDEELFTLLLEFGIDFNVIHDSKYVLEWVTWQNSIELLTLCIKYGADPYINDMSLLKIAISHGRGDLTKYLLELGLVIDSNFECKFTFKCIINLLNSHNIPHNLNKYNI